MILLERHILIPPPPTGCTRCKHVFFLHVIKVAAQSSVSNQVNCTSLGSPRSGLTICDIHVRVPERAHYRPFEVCSRLRVARLLQAFVSCSLGLQTVAGALVGMGLMQLVVGCTLSMLLRHTKRYAVLGKWCGVALMHLHALSAPHQLRSVPLCVHNITAFTSTLTTNRPTHHHHHQRPASSSMPACCWCCSPGSLAPMTVPCSTPSPPPGAPATPCGRPCCSP